jgi:hypothetical protein
MFSSPVIPEKLLPYYNGRDDPQRVARRKIAEYAQGQVVDKGMQLANASGATAGLTTAFEKKQSSLKQQRRKY